MRIVSIDAGGARGGKDQRVGCDGGEKERTATLELLAVRIGFNQIGKHLSSSCCRCHSGRGSWRVRQRANDLVPENKMKSERGHPVRLSAKREHFASVDDD